MAKYVATVNISGYLPMDDDPPVFDSAKEAWEYLAEERERGEDSHPEWVEEHGCEISPTLAYLNAALDGNFVEPDGTGTVYGPTPGYDGNHDLGLAYSVSVVE